MSDQTATENATKTADPMPEIDPQPVLAEEGLKTTPQNEGEPIPEKKKKKKNKKKKNSKP